MIWIKILLITWPIVGIGCFILLCGNWGLTISKIISSFFVGIFAGYFAIIAVPLILLDAYIHRYERYHRETTVLWKSG